MRTVVVSPVGFVATANGAALLAAVAGIVASPAGPILVKVEPGSYALGTTSLNLPSWVDLEGSGRDMTTITGTGTGGVNSVGTILVEGISSIRQVAVQSSGGANTAAIRFKGQGSIEDVDVAAFNGTTSNKALVLDDNASARVDDAAISASGVGESSNYGIQVIGSSSVAVSNVRAYAGGAGNNFGISALDAVVDVRNSQLEAELATAPQANYGFYIFDAWLTVRSSDVLAIFGTGYGLYLDSSGGFFNPIRITDSSLDAQQLATTGTALYGIYATAGGTDPYYVHVQSSRIKGLTNTIRGDDQYTFQVGASQLDGGVVNANSGTVACAGVYTEAYTFNASTCP